MRKVALWVGAVLLTPVLLFVILTVLLYLPPVQNWAVQKVAAVASEKTGMAISVDRVGLSFPLDLSVSGFKAILPNDSLPQVRDTIADVGNLVVNVSLRPLFSKRVVINTLDLRSTKLNTAGFVAAARVKGTLDRLFLTSRGIDLDRSTVDVTNALLEGAKFDVTLSDTVPPDTSTTKNIWKIYINKVDVASTDVAVHMAGDTLDIAAHIGKASAEQGVVDLENELYSVGNFTLANGTVNYDNRFEPRLKGLDANHIALFGVNLSIDSIYYKAPDTHLYVRYCRMKEKSGLELSNLQGPLSLDSLQLQLPSLVAQTPDSRIEAQLTMALDAFADTNPGKVSLRLLASIGKQDIMLFCGDMPQQFVRRWPNRPLTVRGSVDGNLRDVTITGLEASLPTAFWLKANGEAHNPTDIDRLKADVKLTGRTEDLGFVTCLLDPSVMRNYSVPKGIGIDGTLKARSQRYNADLKLTESKGRVTLKGDIDTKTMSYAADVDISNLDLKHFMPHDSFRTLTANLSAKGRGFDFLSKSCRMNADAVVKQFRYGNIDVDNVVATASLADGVGHAVVDSHNALLDGKVSLDALVSTKRVAATLGTDLSRADLYAMRLVEQPMTVGACAHIDIASDLKQSHMVKGNVDDMAVITKEKTFRPADLAIDLLTNRDTTWADVSSGNLELHMRAQGGYEQLMEQGQKLMAEVETHMKNKIIDQTKIRTMLPVVSLHLTSGGENPFANFLRMNGVSFDQVNLDLSSSPAKGLNGGGHVYSLVVDSTRIDTVAFSLSQSDSTSLRFNARVENNKRNPQFVFRALCDGELLERGAGVNLSYYDADDNLGVKLGAKAEMLDSGINVHLAPYRPVLGYKEFNLNKDNYVFLGRDKRISANIDVIADDGTGVKIYSNDDDREMLQDLTVSLNKFDLAKITSVIPYAPSVDGLLNGDFRVMVNKDEKISMLSDLSVGGMTYEHCPMGDISSEFVYLQRDSSSHYVDARLNRNGVDVGTLSGTYMNRDGGLLDATLNLTRTPMSMVNGFIPDQLFGLIGYAEGEVSVKGAISSPQVDGEVYLDSAFLISVPYGLHLRADDDPVRIVGSNLLLENFALYAHNDNPLNIAGNIDFSNLEKIKLAMRMRANDYLLIDSKKTSRSVAYGKAYVNFFGNVNGDFDNLSMRGKLDVLGKTDMTYVLTSSPLNTDDQLKDLVTFKDFRDTTTVVAEAAPPPINGLDMQLMMNIESGARVFCALNADQSNYVDVEGGGELRMIYNTTDDLQLFGRYTMTDGEMKYSLPVIPLKTFKIKDGSYVEFSGDVMNPRLNIEATEEVKSSVSADNGGSRTVLFNCGVKVTQTLNDMGLEFTLEAPEDMTITNELATMSKEMRGRVAVTMLTTGMYLSDGNTGNFSMNSALNTFLQSEISNITNSALRTTDISLGMDQNSDASGNTYTDYSFKFAKRFWNNRINFVIGGKISDSGSASSSSQGNTFIDNVSLEYRLDQSAQRYVRLFYDKEAQDLLEDRISEYGAGFVWRKKMDRLSDLFRSSSNTNQPLAPVKRDSTKVGEK